MIGVMAFGLVGATLTVAGIFLMAVRWRGRTGFPYCFSAFVLYSLLYVATFEHALVNAEIGPEIGTGTLLTLLFLGQALVTATGVSIFVLLLFGTYLALLGPLEFPGKRLNSYASCALFCFIVAIVINPIQAVRKNEDPASRSIYLTAMTAPSPESIEAAGREAKRTLDALREIGALTRIDATETMLIHHVRGQFLDLPNAVVKEYMRAALFHYIHFEGGTVKAVVLRVTDSDREIALLEPNGRFRRDRAVAPQIGSLPPAR
jgi:hypothetical protein